MKEASKRASLDLQQAIHALDASISDASKGLPEEVFEFVSRMMPLVNVDLLIRDANGKTLLTWRDDKYHPPGWHLPGGILRFKESLLERAAAVARYELGAVIECLSPPIAVHQIFDTTRDVRGHFISFLYEGTLTTPPDQSLCCADGLPKHGQWMWHHRCPDNLIPVHEIYRCEIDNVHKV